MGLIQYSATVTHATLTVVISAYRSHCVQRGASEERRGRGREVVARGYGTVGYGRHDGGEQWSAVAYCNGIPYPGDTVVYGTCQTDESEKCSVTHRGSDSNSLFGGDE